MKLSVIRHGATYDAARYDPVSKSFRVGNETFQDFARARSRQWKCVSCAEAFATMKALKRHRGEYHAY